MEATVGICLFLLLLLNIVIENVMQMDVVEYMPLLI
jgi:hypothetical protein